jgi:hypothetical protein
MKSIGKDFENFELRLKTLREESREDFDRAEKLFDEKYRCRLEEIFPRDILGAKKSIAWRFIVWSIDHPEEKHNFKVAVEQTIQMLSLSIERKQSLIQHILQSAELSESLHSFFKRKDDISRDPFFALVEDFAIDGDISKEEFILLQQSYQQQWDFLKSLEALSESVRDMFHSHIEKSGSHEFTPKKAEFKSEFSRELWDLEWKWLNIEPVIVYVSRNYYKTPGKLRKYEHPKRRMRRTFKMALLKLLRLKLGNIDASIILEKFESWESFEDFFMLLYKLLEVVNENPEGKEVFSLLNLDEEIQDEVFTAEENKQKILAWESLVMKIASLFSEWDAKSHEDELWDGMLEKILDETTDIVWEDVYFNRESEQAGIYAEATQTDWDTQWDQDEYDNMSPDTAYEMLKRDFHNIEEEKRIAFWEGRYDDIDVYNESLLGIQSKLEKLSKLMLI